MKGPHRTPHALAHSCCRMYSRDATSGDLTPPRLPRSNLGCLGKNSVEQPVNKRPDESGLYSDCFDCTASLLAIGTVIRNSGGRITLDMAKLQVAEDMYASGLAVLDELAAFTIPAGEDTSTCEEQLGRRLLEARARGVPADAAGRPM